MPGAASSRRESSASREVEAKRSRRETASLRFLSRLQKAGLVGRRLQRRRRPPAAGSGQPPGQGVQCPRTVDERRTRCRDRTAAAPAARRPRDAIRAIPHEPETDITHGDHARYALLPLPKRSASARASRSARASSTVPFLLETQLASYRAFLQEGTPCEAAQERRPAGRVHVDLPDLEPLGQRPARVRRASRCCRRRSTSSNASSAA